MPVIEVRWGSEEQGAESGSGSGDRAPGSREPNSSLRGNRRRTAGLPAPCSLLLAPFRWLLIFLALWAIPASAKDPQAEAFATINSLAEALASDDSYGFLGGFDLDEVSQRALRDSVLALIAAAQVSSSAELISGQGDDQKQNLELDWFLDIHSRGDLGPTEQRHQTVKVTLTRGKKGWRIISFQPADFFRPLSTGPGGASRNSSRS